MSSLSEVGIMEEQYLTKAVHDEFARRVDEENDRQNARISALETGLLEVNKITVQIERLTANIETMTGEIKKQGARLDAIEERPAKRWDTIITAIITGAVGILIGLISSGVLK